MNRRPYRASAWAALSALTLSSLSLLVVLAVRLNDYGWVNPLWHEGAWGLLVTDQNLAINFFITAAVSVSLMLIFAWTRATHPILVVGELLLCSVAAFCLASLASTAFGDPSVAYMLIAAMPLSLVMLLLLTAPRPRPASTR